MSRLEKVANFAVILACVVFSAGYASEIYSRSRVAHPAVPYKAGDIVKDTPELGLTRARMTLVLITRSSCHFCSASMPFYHRLMEVAKHSGVRLVGATSEDPKVNQAYLALHEVLAEAIISAEQNQIEVHGTPTLILVRSDGRVVNSWLRQLPEAREKEVLKTIEKGS